jgi:arylsulfatase A-like enzyme
MDRAKNTFLEGGIRVPAMISYPSELPKGQVRDQIVTIMDWFPTVLELCGIKQEASAPKLDGHSLVSIIAEQNAASAHEVLHFAWANKWAVRRGDWKLISNFNAKTKSPTLSLHNLAEPNPEVKDYAKEQPEIVKELAALHEAWEKEVEPLPRLPRLDRRRGGI